MGWFFSFEAECRGARRVLAIDSHVWKNGAKEGFELARKVLGSKVEDKEIDVMDISPQNIGIFDYVLFLGGFSCMEINILIVSIYGNKLKSITQHTGQVALFVNIVSKSDGTLTIELPRIILDSKRQDNSDYTYQVMVDGKDASF